MVIPKKSLGQNFLKSERVLDKIVDAIDLSENDVVLEIGPGLGALTDKIITRFKDLKIEKFKLIAIEKDRELAENLKQKFKNKKNIEIIEGDALKILPELCFMFQVSSFKIVGNIPYYITGHLFRILEELGNKPSKIILMVQKEVAQRICAPKYEQKMNLLALSTQFYADVKILFYVSKGNFWPVPKVDSAVIEIIPANEVYDEKFRKIFFKTIKAGFSNKRKLLASNLSGVEGILKSISVNPLARAEELSLEEWKNIVLALI